MNYFKKIFVTLLSLFILNVGISPAVFAAPQQSVEQKHKAATEKIQRLKVLENLERNKLHKNQQKLESTSASLAVSQTQLSSIESQLRRMERELAVTLAEFNEANKQMQERIKKVFKTQRKGMFQLILTASDLNSLLDII